MEQNMRFGLILGRLAVLKKKIGSIMSNFCGRFFHVFVGKQKCWNLKNKHCSVCTKKLHYISFIKSFFYFFYWQKIGKYSQSIVYCSTRDTFLRDFYIMTLWSTAKWIHNYIYLYIFLPNILTQYILNEIVLTWATADKKGSFLESKKVQK